MSENALNDRIQARLQKLGKSERAASLDAKLSDAFIRNIRLSKSNSPRSDTIAKLAKVLGTTEAWLLRGEGPEVVGQPMVGSFDPDAPDDAGVDDRTDERPAASAGGDVANLSIRGGMGLGTSEDVARDDSGQIYADHVNGFWSFPEVVKAGWRSMPNVYSVPVTGDSMEPTLTSGSYVFLDMTHTIPSPPDIYAIDYGDGLMIKRVELIPMTDKVNIISDNKRYSDYELHRSDVRVYGRVVAWFQWRG